MTRLLANVLTLAVLSACTNDPGRPIVPPPQPPPPPPSPVGSVVVTPTADTIRPLDTIALKATVFDTGGRVLAGFPVTWLSDHTERATVSDTGLVAGVGDGSVRIRVIADQKSAETSITVLAPLALTGIWDFVQDVVDPFPIACSDTGSFKLVQTGDELSGQTDKTSTCVQTYGTGAVYGEIVGSKVWFFDHGGCYYSATVPPVMPIVLNGHVSCSHEGFRPEGSFTAAVGKPVADVRVVPPSWRMVPTGVTQFTVVMRDSSGRRVFERPIHWDSDNQSVAQIDTAGILTALDLGGTSVTASTADGPRATSAVSVETVQFLSVTAGFTFTCGTTTTGAACWGWNAYLSLGNGLRQNSATPVPLPDSPVFTRVAAFPLATHACGLTASGSAYCWGHELYGALGDGNGIDLDRSTPTPVVGGHSFKFIALGGRHTCALDQVGKAWCWGSGSMLGQPTWPPHDSDTPVEVYGGFSFVSLAGGEDHTCGLTGGGQAYCWGLNSQGQLGVDSFPDRPVAVSGGLTFTALTAGRYTTCGLTTDSLAYCWGSNDWGELGTGFSDWSKTPIPVAGGLRFIALAGGYEYTCGIAADGVAYCWGRNGPFLGLGPLDPYTGTRVPTRTIGDVTFVSITAGGGHVCGLTAVGEAYCWGFHLSNGSVTDSYTPVRIAGQP